MTQLLITSRIMRGVDSPVVLPEKLLPLTFGEISQDHQGISRVFRWLCGHASRLRSPHDVS